MRVSLLARIFAALIRLASVCSGIYIEYREVFVVMAAQWIIVLLGLWLMAIPPALWLDSLRRLMHTAESLTAPGDGNPAEGSSPTQRHSSKRQKQIQADEQISEKD